MTASRRGRVHSAGSLSAAEARRMAIVAQGLGAPRPSTRRLAGPAALRAVMDRVGTIQLDAVNVLARTQLLVPFSRIGAYDPRSLARQSEPGGAWFEYWGHAASLLPLEHHPLLRWRMARMGDDLVDSGVVQDRRRAWRAEHAAYLAAVLAEVGEHGPLTAARLSDPRRRSGTWWDRRSDGRRALEVLFGDGVLAAWRNAAFERVYDLAERVIPRDVLDTPTPEDVEAQRRLVLLAARSLGVGTAADLADYFWLRQRPARQRVAELVEDGRLLEVAVQGWAAPAYVLPGAAPGALRRQHATLLSPFDSLIWNRDRTERLFGIRYRIEIYVPAAQRTYGYYVLPVLLGDRIVARLDLKADRRAGLLRVQSAVAEPGQDSPDVAEAVLAELAALGSWLGLERIAVAGRGDLAARLGAPR